MSVPSNSGRGILRAPLYADEQLCWRELYMPESLKPIDVPDKSTGRGLHDVIVLGVGDRD
jgi:hypothetical protein